MITSIPGMIEPSEERLLFKLASSIDFNQNDCAVEFGCFFGKSTACIAAALASRPSGGISTTLFAYDSFQCDVNGGFAPHVLSFAQLGSVTHLIQTENNKISFFPIFKHYLSNYIESGTLIPIRSELVDSQPTGHSIALMHIDSPKFYTEFKTILFRFFPKLKVGSFVVFQDFFYHWSASLIAAVGLLIELGFLKPTESAASALACQLIKPIDFESATEVDLILCNEHEIPKNIDRAIQSCNSALIDRPEIFIPRLRLAQLQYHLDKREGEKAAKIFVDFFNGGGRVNMPLANDFIELIQRNFSVRRQYELDHSEKTNYKT